jgi:hypothetical protein
LEEEEEQLTDATERRCAWDAEAVEAKAALGRRGHVLRRRRTAVTVPPSHHPHRVMLASEPYDARQVLRQ